MEPRKLTRLFYGFIAAVVMLALFLYFYQKQQTRENIKTDSANVVSYIDSATIESEPIQRPRKAINLEAVLLTNETEAVNAEGKEKLSYIEVYRQLQVARACEVFYRFWREQGLSADLSGRVSRPHHVYGQPDYPGTEQVPLTPGQSEVLENWVQQCFQLWQEYGVFNNDDAISIPLNDVRDSISQALLNTVPKTNEEQDLKNIRSLAVQWTASFKVLESAYEGEDGSDAAVSQSLYEELQRLEPMVEEAKSQWFAAQSDGLPEEESLRNQYFDLLRQLRVLKQRIQQQKVVDPDQLAQAVASLEGLDQAMNHALKTKHADVFFEIIYAFNYNQTWFFHYLGFNYLPPNSTIKPANQHRITPDQMVVEIAGLENPIMQQWELRYALHLYLCDLGWDCGPKSAIVMNYCLFGLISYPAACEQDLPSFYQAHLISPNRWQDVLKFKSLYKDFFYE